MESKDLLYRQLFDTYKKCHKDKKPADCQKNVNLIWNNFKTQYDDSKDFYEAVNDEVQKLNEKISRDKARLTYFFSQVCLTVFTVFVNVLILKQSKCFVRLRMRQKIQSHLQLSLVFINRLIL